MSYAPSQIIQDAFCQPVIDTIIRVEVYEEDGETPWRKDLWNDWLVDGSISAGIDGDERRSFECELDNYDGSLDPGPGKLWYDKVFKVIYGIKLDQVVHNTGVVIVEEYQATGQAMALKILLDKAGIKYVRYNPLAVDYSDIKDFDVVISISNTYSQKLSLLNEAYNKGKSVITFGLDYTSVQLPLLVGSTSSSQVSNAGDRMFIKGTLLDSIMAGWDQWYIAPGSYRMINTVASNTQTVALTSDDTNGISAGVLRTSSIGGSKWMHIVQAKFTDDGFDDTIVDLERNKDNFSRFIGRAISWMSPSKLMDDWEMQCGEYISDSIADADAYGERIKVTGKDYSMRCLMSKLPAATMHLKNESVESVIKTHALNAGIRKFNLPQTNKTLDKDTTWEGDTERWKIMKDLATSNNYDLYFDSSGYLVMKEFNDPLLTPATLVLTTGLAGNLISRGAKTSGNRLKNHIVAVGESSDSKIPPVWAEVKNENPSSPTSIKEIGDRVDRISSAMIVTPQQALDLANSILAVSALEEFELNFSSVLFPWIEPGEILEMNDPESKYWGPSKYLISSLTFPLNRTPMSGAGKRVTNVG